MSAGSMSTASVGPAEQQVAIQVRQKLLEMAISDSRSPIHGGRPEVADFKDGKIFLKSAPRKGEPCSIFHATGKRVRELPITPDKLI